MRGGRYIAAEIHYALRVDQLVAKRHRNRLKRRSVQSYWSASTSLSAEITFPFGVINNARNEVRNEESCGAINPWLQWCCLLLQ